MNLTHLKMFNPEGQSRPSGLTYLLLKNDI